MNPILPTLDSSLFQIDLPTMPPSQGALLVAEPFLREIYFNHSVIFLAEYEKGSPAMGIVLNKPTGFMLNEAIEDLSDADNIPVFCGGPVATDRLIFIHTLGNTIPKSREIAPGLFFGGDFEAVKAYINMGLPTTGYIRFFVGYSSWESGQLEEEIGNHVWAVAPRPLNSELLNEEADSYWYHIVRTSLGKTHRNWLYHPFDPQFN